MSYLGARDRAREELARAINERDAQRVAVEQKALEVEAQAAELWQNAVALE